MVKILNWYENNFSIRNKLKFAITGFALLTLIIFTLAITLTAYTYFHKKTRIDLQILTNVFSNNVSASVIFNDPEAATKILYALQENPHIIKAVILKDNKIFASYPSHQSVTASEKDKTGIWLSQGNYYISVPIVVTNNIIGKLILVSDLKEWDTIKTSLYVIFFSIVTIMFLLTFIISLWLKYQITNPLQEISDWAKNVTKTQNFSKRAVKKHTDEIGSLVDSLNTMLAELIKQESILALNKKLTEEINEREKVEKELVATRDQAELANKSKSLFLANMSHEIRTPLNGIIGMTHFLLRTKLDSAQSEYARTIQQSGQTLLTIINEILDFSKIESGNVHLEIIEFNLRLLVEETIETLASLAHAKTLTFGALIQPKVPTWIQGDPARLRQILTNLLGNAIKFTEKGEISLTVFLEENLRDSVGLRFEIIDSGIGIKPEVRERLFKIFSQGDATTSRKYGGTGLGLVISKRLVELMGGEINFENVAPHGTKFWFTIRTKISKKLSHVTPALPSLYGLRILCVDENSINRRSLVQQIESWGMRCDATENGYDAIAKLRTAFSLNDPYAICIIDYAMPMISGLSFAEEIRHHAEIANTPLIILLPFGSTISKDKFTDLGIKHVLTKPVRQSILFDSIVAILDTQPKSNPAETIDVTDAVTEVPLKKNNNNVKILLAEDNAVNQRVVLTALEILGYEADVVTSGIEVLEAINKKNYDLILMDCQMPEMDGYIATQKIRSLEEKNNSKHVTIIAMTANAVVGDREKCVEAGMDDYISKPIDMVQFEQMLEHWLSL